MSNDETLTSADRARYSRHLLLPEIGIAGQEKLKNAKVLVIGAGGLGSPSLLYLAAAGIGTIGIVDFDTVDASNLQRQVLYSNEQVGKSKTACAAERLSELNPEIQVKTHEMRFSAQNAEAILENYDIVLDGSDNFATRYLVNDACVLFKKPNVYGSIYRFEGQASVFAYKDGPCYRCLFPEPPSQEAVPNCAEAGVLGVIAGIIGCIQANECIKLICEVGISLKGRLLLFDALQMSFDELRIDKDPNCVICSASGKINKLTDLNLSCEQNPEQRNTKEMNEITAPELKKELSAGKKMLVLDVRTPQEVALGRLDCCVHIPLQELQERLSELDKASDIVVYCKSGGRSRRAIELLQSNGFSNLRNLTGGLTAWSFEVDPAVVVG